MKTLIDKKMFVLTLMILILTISPVLAVTRTIGHPFTLASTDSGDSQTNQGGIIVIGAEEIVLTNVSRKAGVTGTTFTLERDGTSISNNSVQSLGAGTYNFTVDRTDTQNYSNVYDEELFTINPATPSLILEASPDWNVAPGVQTIVTGSNCPSQILCNLYLQNNLTSNPDIQNFSVGSYIYIYNTTGNNNYSIASATNTITVSVPSNTTTTTISVTCPYDIFGYYSFRLPQVKIKGCNL